MTNDTPIAPVGDGAPGRDTKGRFGHGNKLAKGNPHAARVARLRAALLNAVKPADVREVMAKLLTQAKAGDVTATKELLQRLLGPPESVDFTERLEALEQRIGELTKDRP